MVTVLFACVHNGGRSQMAAAFFNRDAEATKAQAISAGTNPGTSVHPEVVEVMKEIGIDLSSARPRSMVSVPLQFVDRLVTMGCGEACPFVPGLRVEDWALPDPKGKPLDEVRVIRDEIERRVRGLLDAEGWAKSN